MEENLSKWDGFLNNLSDEDVKTKLINAFEILSNVLMKANELDLFIIISICNVVITEDEFTQRQS